MNGLHEMIKREIARRADDGRTYLPFTFIVHDGPTAMTDVAAAVNEIEAQTEVGNLAERVTIASGIRAAVEATLREKHPKQFSRHGVCIIARVMVDSSKRQAEDPALDEGRETRAAEALLDRAAERIAALRERRQ